MDIKIGYIIADKEEYAPVYSCLQNFGGIECNIKSMTGHKLFIKNNNNNITVHTLFCGVGKVNAACGACLLLNEGVDYMLNSGLSGGINGVCRGDVVIADGFLEHDFDLTCLGYQLGEKPWQEYIYKADQALNQRFYKKYPDLKHGFMASGDRFISDNDFRIMLKEKFNAVSCDMETAAIAYACKIYNVPFTSIRKISDDAGKDATTIYRQMNNLQETTLLNIVLSVLTDF